ncbi:MAG: hypothetical protein LBU89_03005 [Fibromonadaceae bacterium]|jgi:protein-S-isoprenylcysteine O-methyltransferase Ste14|nr:hypothetical protein [Fibromonadaceae bacterium]
MLALYSYRGLLTALLGVLLLFLPVAPFEFAGIAFFAAATFLRIWARRHIGEHSRGAELACPKIVQSGPYKYTRHPLYISNFMAGVAFALFHSGFSLGTLIFCSIYGVFLALLARQENIFLESCPNKSQVSSLPIIKSIKNDRYTWLWQFLMLALIYCRKMI